MSVSQAKVWLNEKEISRVYYGPQEQEDLPAGRQGGRGSKTFVTNTHF